MNQYKIKKTLFMQYIVRHHGSGDKMADNVGEIKDEDTGKSKLQFGKGTVIIIVVMIVVAILIYFNVISDKTYSSYTEIMTVERDDDGNTQYIQYDEDKIIKYNHDGIEAIDSSGKKIWSAAYDIKNPVAVTSGESVAVADLGGQTLLIYNGDGKVQNVEILKPITHVAVSNQGIAAVVLKDDNCSYIEICDGDTVYAEIKTRIKEDGYPVAIAYSQDGKKLVTSYVKVSGESAQSMLTFYNFSEVGKNYDSDIVRAEDFGEHIIPELEFLDSTHVGVFVDNKIQVYKMKEIPELVFETDEYNESIRSVAYNESYVAFVEENASEGKKTLHVYSLNGKETGKHDISINYTDILISGEDIILYNSKEIQIITKNGNEKLHLENDKIITKIIGYKDNNKYYLINADDICLVKLERGNE